MNSSNGSNNSDPSGTRLDITLDLDTNPWTDLLDRPVIEGTLTRVGVFPHGMQSGLPALMLEIVMPDGTHVLASTSWRILHAVDDAMHARYGCAQ